MKKVLLILILILIVSIPHHAFAEAQSSSACRSWVYRGDCMVFCPNSGDNGTFFRCGISGLGEVAIECLVQNPNQGWVEFFCAERSM